MKPNEIEKLSFSLIDKEAGPHSFTSLEWRVVRRMIHTSADFDYLQTVRFGNDPITSSIQAIKKGCVLFTDTEMVKAGIRKKDLEKFGCTITCYMNDREVAAMAQSRGTTRALESVTKAAPDLNGSIYVIGNAPTALLHLIELIQKGRSAPTAIIGFPVGFVNAAESKALLEKVNIPYVTNVGRKGGSNIAASVVNALVLLAMEQVGTDE